MQRHLPLLDALSTWQTRARQRFPKIIPCRPGCSACCQGPFDIPTADVAVVLEGFRALPRDDRRAILTRARADVEAMRALVPGWIDPYDIADIGEEAFDRAIESHADRPCPLLDDEGRCLIYAHRPVVCRIIGIGLLAESGSVLENECPIQDRFPGYPGLPPYPFPLEQYEAKAEAANREAAEALLGDGDRHRFETTIAAALVKWGAADEEAP
ncbi:MAG: YkgJ family cysteine cluster protein [Gemmatimonadetes bacterium]|nr:YkgJ family cysteine cluster protein [Gemmatimonadota bacterium]